MPAQALRRSRTPRRPIQARLGLIRRTHSVHLDLDSDSTSLHNGLRPCEYPLESQALSPVLPPMRRSATFGGRGHASMITAPSPGSKIQSKVTVHMAAWSVSTPWHSTSQTQTSSVHTYRCVKFPQNLHSSICSDAGSITGHSLQQPWPGIHSVREVNNKHRQGPGKTGLRPRSLEGGRDALKAINSTTLVSSRKHTG